MCLGNKLYKLHHVFTCNLSLPRHPFPSSVHSLTPNTFPSSECKIGTKPFSFQSHLSSPNLSYFHFLIIFSHLLSLPITFLRYLLKCVVDTSLICNHPQCSANFTSFPMPLLCFIPTFLSDSCPSHSPSPNLPITSLILTTPVPWHLHHHLSLSPYCSLYFILTYPFSPSYSLIHPPFISNWNIPVTLQHNPYLCPSKPLISHQLEQSRPPPSHTTLPVGLVDLVVQGSWQPCQCWCHIKEKKKSPSMLCKVVCIRTRIQLG